jgi:hypothetical protein
MAEIVNQWIANPRSFVKIIVYRKIGAIKSNIVDRHPMYVASINVQDIVTKPFGRVFGFWVVLYFKCVLV